MASIDGAETKEHHGVADGLDDAGAREVRKDLKVRPKYRCATPCPSAVTMGCCDDVGEDEDDVAGLIMFVDEKICDPKRRWIRRRASLLRGHGTGALGGRTGVASAAWGGQTR